MNTSRRQQEPAVAYFSMEIALDPRMPTYSGGLGVLAGDILRSAADLGVPMIGVTLIHRKGYYQQELDEEGNQIESSHDWRPEDLLEPLEPVVSVEIEEREVHLRVWQFLIQGVDTHSVPVLLLDAALPENTPWDRSLTDQLYGGDEHYRLCQEALLGLGGVAALTALGYDSRILYHMNEGHSALLTIPLLETAGAGRGGEGVSEGQIEAVRKNCVFTTHTPVPAGHDQFPIALVRQVLGPARTALLHKSECLLDDTLNMTYLALRFSGYINGVSMRHGEVSFDMFPGYPIHAITNGVHVVTWTCEAFQKLYDEHIPGWRFDTRYLRYAIQIPHEKIQESHRHAKHKLLAAVESRSGIKLGEDVFTIAFARRATPYKRADLLLRDPGRLREIAARAGPLQILYAGKAHPRDEPGKDMIRRIFQASKQLDDRVRLVYLKNYDWPLARDMVAGADLWLNTPLRPREASGTSGMKAACNGVPSLSVRDGWWIEGHLEGVTGWSLLDGNADRVEESDEVAGLYGKLERVILPLFYQRPSAYAEIMRAAIAINASFFNTQRVLSQYVRNAYRGLADLVEESPAL